MWILSGGGTYTEMRDRHVLVITGAGVSAESGIPTFRGKDGYWRNFDPAKLATPEAFARDPKLVWEWYRERRQRIREAQPNAAHQAIAKLAQYADEFLLVTQNVDDLHVRAGLPIQKDRKSTRLNSSHQIISYAVFCLKKKKKMRKCTGP